MIRFILGERLPGVNFQIFGCPFFVSPWGAFGVSYSRQRQAATGSDRQRHAVMIEHEKVALEPNAAAPKGGGSWRDKMSSPGFLCLLLALATLALFLPVTWHDFVNYDDPGYVTENYHVEEGLTWEGVHWAFTSRETGNWIPLTWLSHMSDCRLFGLKPAGHHLTNLLFHIANAFLLFLILRRMTGAVWRSAFVAALFAWHPLRVESVAWVSERKDVLSAFFWMLAVGAYVRYAQGNSEIAPQETGVRGHASEYRSMQHATRHTPPSSVFYLLSLLFFALGLMSKPMVVTLPFVLLLLDYWPLQRFQPSTLLSQASTFLRLAAEKVPFFLLVIPASIVTFAFQKSSGAVSSLSNLPVTARLANAVISYPRYLGKMIWPADLAVLYPHPIHWPAGLVALAAVLLLGLTFGAVRLIRSRPYLLAGWLWFLGTLVPVIGLVQAGSQAIADRYTYLPSIGLFIALTWWVSDLWCNWHYSRLVLGAAAASVLVALAGVTHYQLPRWQDSETLFGYAIEVTDKNTTAFNNRGFYLAGKGRLGEAILDFESALQINPENADAHSNLGSALGKQGKLPEAVAHYQAALRLKPDHAGAHYNLGKACENAGQMKEAMAHYMLAIRSKPEYADAHNNLGIALATEGKLQEAELHLKQAVRFKPNFVEALNNLGNVLTAQGRNAEAVVQFSAALRLQPDYLNAHSNLALALARMGKTAEAVDEYDAVLRLNPNDVDALCSKAWVLSAQANPEFRNGHEAVRLATRAVTLTQERDAGALDALAAAHAGAPSNAPQPAGKRSWRPKSGSACKCTNQAALTGNPDPSRERASLLDPNQLPISFSNAAMRSCKPRGSRIR
jgi:tetratricopeptide (TPR) repeat protein